MFFYFWAAFPQACTGCSLLVLASQRCRLWHFQGLPAVALPLPASIPLCCCGLTAAIPAATSPVLMVQASVWILMVQVSIWILMVQASAWMLMVQASAWMLMVQASAWMLMVQASAWTSLFPIIISAINSAAFPSPNRLGNFNVSPTF